MPVRRRFDVRIDGRQVHFRYRSDRQRYRVTFGDIPYEGHAASLPEARDHVRRIIRAALELSAAAPPAGVPGRPSGPPRGLAGKAGGPPGAPRAVPRS